jgi:2-oxoglutarate ferredoxin oxidoreductase subunit alpha
MVRKDGIKAGLIRPITLWPFPEMTIEKHVDHAKAFLSVEMNMGQMVEDVKLVVHNRKPVRFYGRTGGVIPTPNEVYDCIVKLNKGEDL